MSEERLFVLHVFLSENRSFKLGFRTQQAANIAYGLLTGGDLEVEVGDDFGTQLHIGQSEVIRDVILAEPVKEFELQNLVQLIQARAQQRLQEAARRDPVLNRGQGPGLVLAGPGVVPPGPVKQ